MSRASPARFAIALVVVAIASSIGACDRRVVDLPDPRADAAATANSGNAGTMSATTGMSMSAPTGSGTVMNQPPITTNDPGVPVCKVTLPGSDRCAICAGPDGSTTNICLKCEATTMAAVGGQCRICVWSNDVTRHCLQCFDPNGKTQQDDCDSLRKEMFVYPDPSTDPGGKSGEVTKPVPDAGIPGGKDA